MIPHHKGPQHRWKDEDVETARELAIRGVEAMAKHFHVTVGAMVMFCKRKGIEIPNYRYRSPQRHRVSA